MAEHRGRKEKIDGLFRQYMAIAAVVASFWMISIGTDFVNKALLSQEGDLGAPVFITWCHCVLSSVFCLILTKLGRFLPGIDFPDIKISLEDGIKTSPVSLLFVAIITFNHMCLQHVGVAFYYLVHSLSIFIDMVIAHFFLPTTFSNRTVSCCLVITFGYLLGVDQEALSDGATISWITFGIFVSFLISINNLLTKTCLLYVKNSVLTLTLYNNLVASILLIPLMFILDAAPSIRFVPQLQELRFWTVLLIGSICGLSIKAISALQIKVTSALTHNISETAAAAAQTIIEVWIKNEVKSSVWWVSNYIGLIGSFAYTKVRQLDMEKEYRLNLLPTHKTDNHSGEQVLQDREVGIDSSV